MKSIRLQAAQAKAKEIDEKLTVYDFDIGRQVTVITDECGFYQFPNAFILKYDSWYLVFSEHVDPHVFHEEDVNAIYESIINRKIKNLKDFKFRKKK